MCVYIEQSNWIYLPILFTLTYIHNTRILPCWKTKTRPYNMNDVKFSYSLAQQHFLLIYLSLSWGCKHLIQKSWFAIGLIFFIIILRIQIIKFPYYLVSFIYLIFVKSIWIHGYLTIQKLEHSYWNFKMFLRNNST